MRENEAETCLLLGVIASASRVRHYMGDIGIRILTRLIDLLLVALAVQFMINEFVDVLKPLKQLM
jgi:small neutral amino acid transporter SnatA (MarC family)